MTGRRRPPATSRHVTTAMRGTGPPRFAARLAHSRSALIQVGLRSWLTPDEQQRAISLVRQAVTMPTFHRGYGGTDMVTGAPVVLDDLAAKVTASVGVLLIAAVFVMA